MARESFVSGSLSSVLSGANAGAGSWPRLCRSAGGEERGLEEGSPTTHTQSPDLVFEEGWITGLLGFWGTNIALCAGVTFARVRGAVSVLAKRTLSLFSLAAAMSCLL